MREGRSLRATRTRLSATAGLCLLILAVGGPASATPKEFPVSSTGDVWFQADYAGFRDETGEVVEEYYLRVTNSQLRFQEAEDGYEGNVFVHLKFLDEDDDEIGEASHRYRFTVPNRKVATSADDAQILLFREPLDPRTRSVRVEVEDLNARKRGLLYLVTGKRRNGSAEGALRPPPCLGRGPGVSDIQFAWTVESADSASRFEKNGLDVIPNPSRTYGLRNGQLAAYYEVYVPDSRGEQTYYVHSTVRDPDGLEIGGRADTVTSSGTKWTQVVRLDLNGRASGQYTLRSEVTLPTGKKLVCERPFSVIWRSGSWARTEQDMLDEARVLLEEEEFARFESMSAGDRELYLERFWADVDPSPGTRQNEVRDEFLRRVAFANRHFSTGRRGMLTDRGRIYIRFGEPDEIERELIPTKNRQLDGLVGDLNRENPKGRTLATHDEIDVRPFEIWTYTQQGTPLFPGREFTTSKTGLRFVFVDETGTGTYVLRYSSDFIGY